VAKTIVFYLQTDDHGRCIGSQSQSEGNGLPSCDNDFETARFGAKGSEQGEAYGREGESRLDENPTTEELKLAEAKSRGKGSEKVSLLRHKLS
jgi:hypothetical protein